MSPPAGGRPEPDEGDRNLLVDNKLEYLYFILIHNSWLVKTQLNNKIENKITAIYISS